MSISRSSPERWPRVLPVIYGCGHEMRVDAVIAGAFAQYHPDPETFWGGDGSADMTCVRTTAAAQAWVGSLRILARRWAHLRWSMSRLAGVRGLTGLKKVRRTARKMIRTNQSAA